MKETLAMRLARQLAETHPGTVIRVVNQTGPLTGQAAIAPAQGEKEKLG